MAMQAGSKNGDSDVIMDMNTTPLIDVMLVLLILLIVTLPIQTHAVKLDMPQTGPQVGMPVVIDLEIDFDGTIVWNGAPVANRATLNWYFESIGARKDQPEIHVRPNRLAKYDVIARTLADAQHLGVRKIAFVGTEQYAE
jgi:biopolymer transport protein ExbD